jgi:calcium-dependent protein kinase
MHRHRLERDEHLYKAFQYFDKDNSGWVLQDWQYIVTNIS